MCSKKGGCVHFGPSVHWCTMFLLLLLLMFDLLGTANSTTSNCGAIPIRKTFRFGKRFSELMQRMKQAHPCLTQAERRSDPDSPISPDVEEESGETQDGEGTGKLPVGLLLKVYTILQQQNGHKFPVLPLDQPLP